LFALTRTFAVKAVAFPSSSFSSLPARRGRRQSLIAAFPALAALGPHSTPSLGQTSDVARLLAQPGVVGVSDRINRTAPTNGTASSTDPLYDSHASTVIQASDGEILMAYFNGYFEGANDQSIYIARRSVGSSTWSAPVAVAGNPSAPYNSSSSNQGNGMYNPVLFQPAGGPLFLYYKQGTPSTWVGYYKTSTDNGLTWSAAVAMPTSYSGYSANAPYSSVIGPSRSKPIQLADGTILFGSSLEQNSYDTYIQRSSSATNPFGTGNWTTSANIDSTHSSIQPTFLYHGGQTIEVLTRMSTGAVGTYIGQSWSYDDGVTWTNVAKTKLPNNWSGIEGQALSDGRYMLFFNPTNITASGDGRNFLCGAISSDGTRWHAAVELQNTPANSGLRYDYPAAIQTSSGQVEVTYSYNHTGIRDVTLDPAAIKGLPMNTSSPTTWQWPTQFYALVTSPAYANLTEDDCNANSGYLSANAAGSGNSFGYQTTNNAMGYDAGEIGGTFSRKAVGPSYFGRSLGGTYTRQSNLIASGQLWKNIGTSGTNEHLYLGFFSSTGTAKANFVGLDITGSVATANIIDSSGGNAATASAAAYVSLSNSTAMNYSMIWDPTGDNGAGLLSISLVTGSLSEVDLSISGAAIGAAFSGSFSVDSFGLYSFGDGSTGAMQAYLDDNAVGAITVPEPAGVAPAAIVAALLCGRRRRSGSLTLIAQAQ
jgi:alpha-L-rhamnosidase